MVQNVFSKFTINDLIAFSEAEFSPYLVFYERVDKNDITDNEVKLLNHKMENQSDDQIEF